MFKKPGLSGYEVAPAILSLRRPKHTVQLAMSRSKKVAKVIQKPKKVKCDIALSNTTQDKREFKADGGDLPGPVIVLSSTSSRSPILCLTYAKSAISIANAMSVRRAARPEAMEARSMRVTCELRESRNAMKVTIVAADNIIRH